METGGIYACPYCNHETSAPGEVRSPFIRCAACGQDFVLPQTEETAHHPADNQHHVDQSQPGEEADRNELDARRIWQVASLRKAAYRSRSYCIIATSGCLVGVAELAYHTLQSRRAGGAHWLPYVLAGIALLFLARHFARLTFAFHREAKSSAQTGPQAPPDLAKLSDGSQVIRKLEEMR
jgi:DNA-directed RNA polymerase subunit RPC12/RpoP